MSRVGPKRARPSGNDRPEARDTDRHERGLVPVSSLTGFALAIACALDCKNAVVVGARAKTAVPQD